MWFTHSDDCEKLRIQISDVSAKLLLIVLHLIINFSTDFVRSKTSLQVNTSQCARHLFKRITLNQERLVMFKD